MLSSSTLVSEPHPASEQFLGSTGFETFVRDYLGRCPLYVSAGGSDLAARLTWSEINTALDKDLCFPQVKLVSSGVSLAVDKYTYQQHDLRFIDSEACRRQMAKGATMIVLSLDRLMPHLGDLMQAFGREYQADARADLVITLVPVPGLKVHWDQTECFNVQVIGEKRWELFQPSRPWPLKNTPTHADRGDETEMPTPAGQATGRQLLKPGDMLYVPRGWWHLVTPTQTPSVHLSVSLDVPLVSDALNWYVHKLKERECVRQNIPSWSHGDEWSEFVAQVREALFADDLSDLLRLYLAELADGRRHRQPFDLSSKGSTRIAPTARVRLQRMRHVSYVVEMDQVIMSANDKRYSFKAAVAPALERLSKRWTTVAELSEGLNDVLVGSTLATLWTDDVVSIS